MTNKYKTLLTATLTAASLHTAVQAEPYCDALSDTASLPKKYQKNGPFTSDAKSGWIIGRDQVAANFDVTNETREIWAAIAAGFAAQGVELLVLSPPPRPLFAPADVRSRLGTSLVNLEQSYSDYIAGLSEAGLVAPDLSPLANATLSHEFYFARDTHWTPYGAMQSGMALAKAAGEMEAGSVPFEASYTEKGSLADVSEVVCGVRPEPEIVPAPNYPTSGSAGLLDGGADPSIALVGSSFSGRNKRDSYQVAGAISHAFDAEVENYSISGGGMAGSMMAFLESGVLEAGSFKRVIWEVPYTTPLTDIGGLRQVLSHLDVHVDVARTQLFDGNIDDGWTQVKEPLNAGQSAVLEIVTPGVDAGELLLELIDATGEKRKFTLRKSNRISGDMRNARWTFAMRDLPEQQVSRFKLRLKGQETATPAQVYLLN